MLPKVEFLGLDLYTWMILVGIIAAMVMFRVFTTKTGLPAKVFNFSLITAIVAIVVGFLSATLFQSYYNYLENGVWEWKGMTFYGGLIGAIVSFMLVYFIAGHFLFKDKLHIREFNNMLCCIIPCIVVAHAFGRIGCVFAGCCHGMETDSWIGIDMWIHSQWVKVVPVQLFESIFLFALFGGLSYMLLKKKNEYIASIYLIAYGVWRFVIEFWRGDDRGSAGTDALSPSQLTAIIMVVAGIALIFLYQYLLKRFFVKFGPKTENGEKADTTTNEQQS